MSNIKNQPTEKKNILKNGGLFNVVMQNTSVMHSTQNEKGFTRYCSS